VRSNGQAFEDSADPCEGGWVLFDGQQVLINEDCVGSTVVEWAFPALEAGGSASLEASYTVLGPVRVLTSAQDINWTVVFADRDAPVETAHSSVHLPPGLSLGDVTVSGGASRGPGRDAANHAGRPSAIGGCLVGGHSYTSQRHDSREAAPAGGAGAAPARRAGARFVRFSLLLLARYRTQTHRSRWW
jgi:hypothetical protein